MDLPQIWFLLLGVLLTGYAILDGFDLGVGILHYVARNDGERRAFMNSIGPLWDGNEVWLVTCGGALFAAFPAAYAAVFSAFYTPFMMLLCCLIMRAVSMEFRSKRASRRWRSFWDGLFFAGSTAASFLFGVSVGNALEGIMLDANGVYQGTFFDFLNPFALLVGLLVVALFAMHGAIYLSLKLEGEIQARIHGWMWRAFGFFLVMYLLTTIVALIHVPQARENFAHYPAGWIVVVVNILAVANIPRAIYLQRPGYAFISSALVIGALTSLLGIGLFPNLVVSSLDAGHNLTIFSAASSEKTLGIMLLFAVIGMPFVLAYTAVIYWVFRGRVKIGHFGY
jgi:cytochrome bd ubiquinol oxidase subunit II